MIYVRVANVLAIQVPDRLETKQNKKKQGRNILQGDLENKNMNGLFRMDIVWRHTCSC